MKIFSAFLATLCAFSSVIFCEDSNPFNTKVPTEQQEIITGAESQMSPLELSTKHGYAIPLKSRLKEANIAAALAGLGMTIWWSNDGGMISGL
jgi:hypothetical protein